MDWPTAPSGGSDRHYPSRNVVAQLSTFLGEAIRDWRPDLIILGERKGTGIFRALMDIEQIELGCQWKSVVSSSALKQLTHEDVRGKKLLIFDDMMRTGSSVERILSSLREFMDEDQISASVRLAVFAAHTEASERKVFEGLGVSSRWFYRDQEDESYRAIRRGIIGVLQESGSLMLDTEHLELRLRINPGFGLSDLLAALRRKGQAVVFHSTMSRTNITVYYGEDEGHRLEEGRFPQNVGFTRIVKKCRIVQRSGSDFAIIPICLPSVPTDLERWTPKKQDCDLLGWSQISSEEGRFYSLALLGSLYPLRWLLRDLYAHDPKVFTLFQPQSTEERGPFNLSHLRVMYPHLDVEALVRLLGELSKASMSEGAELRRRRSGTGKMRAVYIETKELRVRARKLLQWMCQIIDERTAEASALEDGPELTVPSRQGLRAREIFEIGSALGYEAAEISALFDLMIDEGDLVTRVEVQEGGEGRRLVRTFRPDGEVVSDGIRHYNRQWGLPRCPRMTLAS